MLDVLEYRVIDTGFPSLDGYWWLYVPFNIAEGLLWLCIAGFVLFRWARHRRTWLEALYAMSFILFGLTDLIEVIATPLWLLALKGCCLLAILLGRKLVIGHYPGAKL